MPGKTTCSRAWMTADPRAGAVRPGRPYSLLCVEGGQRGERRELGAVAAYAALFVLGVLQGLIGCFQFSHSLGSVPVASPPNAKAP